MREDGIHPLEKTLLVKEEAEQNRLLLQFCGFTFKPVDQYPILLLLRFVVANLERHCLLLELRQLQSSQTFSALGHGMVWVYLGSVCDCIQRIGNGPKPLGHRSLHLNE